MAGRIQFPEDIADICFGSGKELAGHFEEDLSCDLCEEKPLTISQLK